MLIVSSDSKGNVWVCEYGKVAVGFGSDSSALDELVGPIANVSGRFTCPLVQLSTRVFVEHSFAERAVLLPIITSVL